jgi:hypothetical protein
MATTPSWCSCELVRLASATLLAHGAPLMMSSVYAWDYVYPLQNRSVSLAARSSDSGMHVDSCVWSITYVVLRCLCWRLLSRLTWAILLRLAWILWLGHHGTVPWSGASGEKPAAAAGVERGAGADPATPSRPWPCVRRATVRLLYARCGRPLSELGLGQSRLCMGRAHAEPELHVGGYSPHIRRCAVFDEISSNSRQLVTSRVPLYA